jgi:hypothetical protein
VGTRKTCKINFDYKTKLTGNRLSTPSSSVLEFFSRWPAIRDSHAAALLAAQMQATKLEEECRSLRKQTEHLEAERGGRIEELRQSGQEEAARLSERVESLKSQFEERAKVVRLLEGQRDVAAADARAASGEVARLTEREKALSEKVAEQAAQLGDQQKQLTTEFEKHRHPGPESECIGAFGRLAEGVGRDPGPAARTTSGFSEEGRDRLRE